MLISNELVLENYPLIMTFACCTRYFVMVKENNIVNEYSEDDHGLDHTDKRS